jgi:hypothetical protein
VSAAHFDQGVGSPGPHPAILTITERTQQIVQAARFLFTAGDVVEIRIPKAGREKTISGYTDDPQIMARLALENDGKGPGVYWTLNRVSPALKARASDRVKAWAEQTTSDADVILRRNLLIDIDPVRVSGISATDAEHQAALDLTRTIRGELMLDGWPEPLVMSSGNGVYLIYRLPDLQNDEHSRDLIRGVLSLLARRFNTPLAKVDEATFNASRIAKIPGTTARKGDNTADRPHRVARILDLPEVAEAVRLELLEALAAQMKPPIATRPAATTMRSEFDIEGWLGRSDLEVVAGPEPYHGGRRWTLRSCPFNPEHLKPVVLQLASGAPAYRCLHQSCRDRDWRALRALVESSYGERNGHPKSMSDFPDSGPDVDECRAEAEARLHSGRPSPSVRAGDLPHIRCNGRQLRDITAEALAALQEANDPPKLFSRGSKIVAIAQNENGRQQINEVGVDGLRGRLTRTADYNRSLKIKGEHVEIDCAPPLDVVKDILSLSPGAWALPLLDGLTEMPMLRPDGTILNTPGYDAATRLYYSPDPDLRVPEIPERPTRRDVEQALSLIANEVLGEFPFEDESSKTNAIAGMLTPVIKSAINAPTPAQLNDAPQAGSGKSLEAEVNSITATGRPAEMFSLPKDEEEVRKHICTALYSGARVIVFDNINHRVDSGELCKALTATQFADREFRTHDKILLPVSAAFVLTGNNLQISGDLPRLCYWVRLDAKQSRPFLRTGFRHPDLKAWVLEHRGELLAALLTLCRAWFAAGKPKPKILPLGGFEAWTTTVGGILEYAGVKGFLANSMQFYEEADTESSQWESFLLTLDQCFYSEPFTVTEIMDKLHEKSETSSGSALRAAIPDFLAEAMDRDGFFQRRAGKCFAERVDRRYGEKQVHLKRGKLSHGRNQWAVVIPEGQNGVR